MEKITACSICHFYWGHEKGQTTPCQWWKGHLPLGDKEDVHKGNGCRFFPSWDELKVTRRLAERSF